MQLNQFKFLVAVDQYGSISRARRSFIFLMSTVSLALINLEEELGVTILNRSKRGVSFTAEGKMFWPGPKPLWKKWRACRRPVLIPRS